MISTPTWTFGSSLAILLLTRTPAQRVRRCTRLLPGLNVAATNQRPDPCRHDGNADGERAGTEGHAPAAAQAAETTGRIEAADGDQSPRGAAAEAARADRETGPAQRHAERHA